MAYVKYANGIDYVQGSLSKPKKKSGHVCGTYLIGKHRTAATQNPKCTTLFVQDASTFDRSTPLTTKEIGARNRFRTVAAMVVERKDDLSHVTSDQAAFMAQKDLANGKKTMKAYLWYVCGQEYDQQNG